MHSILLKQKILRRNTYFGQRKCWCVNVALIICLLASKTPKTNAVPMENVNNGYTILQQQTKEAAGIHVIHRDTKDLSPTEITLDDSKDQCLFNGVPVRGATVSCETQIGCRAIQKTGHCCPDYKCDCEKDGRVYLNGDKLVDPETPCTVCYCQGGEILCSSVTCFHRDDCTPIYIPGRCCPEYNNCPVSNSGSTNASCEPVLEADITSIKPDVHAMNTKITIKEITKPVEIRITDESKIKPTRLSSTEATMLLERNTAYPQTPQSSLAVNPSQLTWNSRSTSTENVKNKSDYNRNTTDMKLENASSIMNVTHLEPVPPEGFNSAEPYYSDRNNNSSTHKTTVTLDPDTSGSDNIYHIILTTDGPRITSTGHPLIFDGADSEPTSGTYGDPDAAKKLKKSTEAQKEYTVNNNRSTISTEPLIQLSTNGSGLNDEFSSVNQNENFNSEVSNLTHKQTNNVTGFESHYMDDEEISMPIDSNPAYPSLPEDDFSLRDVNIPLSETDDVGEVDTKDQLRHINTHYDMTNITKSRNDSSCINNNDKETESGTLVNISMSSTIALNNTSRINEMHSNLSKPILMITDISPESEKLMVTGDKSKEIAEVNLRKKLIEREPTTPSPKRRTDNEFDIDGLNSTMHDEFEGGEDPKLDVESLKVDETQNEGSEKSGVIVPGNIRPAESSLVED